MTDLVKVKALVAFTHTHATGQYHGDPDNKQAKTPDVPADVVDQLVREGKVEEMEAAPAADAPAPKARKAKAAPAADAPAD